MQLVRSIASRILTLALLWPVSKRPDSGRLVCSGRLRGVQSWTLDLLWTGRGCPESGRSALLNKLNAAWSTAVVSNWMLKARRQREIDTRSALQTGTTSIGLSNCGEPKLDSSYEHNIVEISVRITAHGWLVGHVTTPPRLHHMLNFTQ